MLYKNQYIYFIDIIMPTCRSEIKWKTQSLHSHLSIWK